MNERIPVHNTTAMPMYVAGQMIPAGETRHFDADQVPLHLRPAPTETEAELPPADPLATLLEGTVKEVAAALPDLSDDSLARLGELEQARGDMARKGVLSAIAEATLIRADARADAEARAAAAAAAGAGGA